MAKKKQGRPTKFTKAVAVEILKFLNAGMLLHDAAELAGIHRDTLHSWIAKGQKGRNADLKSFSDEISKARMSAKLRAVGSVHAAMRHNWKAAAWWLGVTDPKNYGPKVRVTLDQEFSDALSRIREKLPADVYEQVLCAIAEDSGAEGIASYPDGETDPLH